MIDFNGIPNGTPVSAGNQYDGILSITAFAAVDWFDGTNLGTSYRESTILDGELVLAPLNDPPQPPPGNFGYQYRSLLTATFAVPVTDVRFDAYCWRNAGYSFRGIYANGTVFTGGGSIPGIIDGQPPATGYATFTPTIPSGGYLTEFSIGNRDPKYINSGVWVDNIRYSVPESSLGITGLITILGVVLWASGRQHGMARDAE